MGNFCIDVCNNINNTLRGATSAGESKGTKQGGKKGKFVDFNIGASTISKEEFKQAAKKKKEEQRKLELIDKMQEQEIERKLKQELEKIQRRQMEKRYLRKDFKYFDETTQQRIYNFSLLDKDELLQQIMGYSTLRMLNEKQCEPLAYFPLKNSDELLWEDHSEYLQNIVLDEIIQLDESESYKSMLWTGKRLSNLKQKYLVEITQIKKYEYLQQFEENFYFNKSIQSLLSLTKQDTISSDIYNVSYQQQWFLLNYSNIFLRVTDMPIATLREVIKIRASLPKTEGAYKEQEILGFLILMMRALRDAKSIYINHGNVNDENIYLSGDGQYKIKGFNELRITSYVVKKPISQTLIKKSSRIYSGHHSEVESEELLADQDDDSKLEDEADKYEICCTHSYLQYYIKQVKPRHLIFFNETIRPVIEKGLFLYWNKNIDKMSQEAKNERLVRNTEDIILNSLIMQQNFYSLAIIAIQMISLGKFEQWCQIKSKTSHHSNQSNKNDISQAAKYIKSFSGLHTDESYLNQRVKTLEEFKEYQAKNYIEIMSFLAQYQLINNKQQNYQIVILYLQDMLKPNCDWKRIMDQLQEEEFDPPNDIIFFQKPNLSNEPISKSKNEKISTQQSDKKKSEKQINVVQQEKPLADQPQTELSAIVDYESNKGGLLIRAFNVSDQFYDLRKYFYQVQGYMLIRNTRIGQEAAKYIIKTIASLQLNDHNKLAHYKISNASEIFFSKTEYVFLKFCLGFCYMQNRELELAYTTFTSLESDIQNADPKTLKKINQSNIKFYQGLITFISGEGEDALQLFNRVLQISKNNLKEINEKAYYQFIHYYFLLQLDQDGYFEAFKYIQQLNEYHEQQCQKYDYISKSLILSCYNRGKAYYEVSQFELSKYYFDISLKLISNITRSGSEMDSLRLLNLGYLSYLNFLTNDMENMKSNLQKAMSIMQEALSSFHCLETVVLFFNFFGFLLKSLYTDLEDMQQQVELFQLTIDNNKRVKIDQFFKKFVFGKMFYYAGDIKKAQELFLDAVQLQQYQIADELRIKQTQNISVHQLKEFQQLKVQMLKDYQEQQKKFKTTLPPPQRDNLTVRLLMEVYDWLGYIYIKQKEEKKAMLCYNLYQQYMYNLFRFEQTLIDEYTMRWAKIQFYLQKYDESLKLFSQLACDLRKQKVDEDLYFEYQQIQSDISRWMGLLYLLQNKDASAKVAVERSKEELMKLYKQQQVNEISKTQTNNSRIGTQLSDPKLLSQEREEQVGYSQFQVSNRVEYVGTSMIHLQLQKRNQKEQNYFKLQQAPILVLLVQNYMRVIWDCISLNLKKLSISYVEEFLSFIEKDKYLNTNIFENVLKSSIRSDVYFLVGYIYGQRGQHEETFIFFKRSFIIIKELYDNNQLDQQLIIKMSLIYDQMSRVLANQGFYIDAKQYLMNSLQLFQQVKKKINPLQIAYKHANLGNLLFKLGQYTDARVHTESALVIFEEEYGKVSVPVLQVRTKLLEILLARNKNQLIKKATLQLIETFKIVCETHYSTKLDGQIDRMIGSYHHKYGNYSEALNLYLTAFIKLLDDNEQGMLLLNQLTQGDKNFKNFLLIKSSDRASLDIALNISSLYVDNVQFENAYDLLIKLLDLSKGIDYDPPELGKIAVLGHDKDEDIHNSNEGILKIISCFNKVDPKKGNLTVFEIRRTEIFDMLKSKRHINLLFIADIYRLLGQILNFWERQRIEAYFFTNYTSILAKYYGSQSKYQSQKSKVKNVRGQQIDEFQNQIFNFLIDSLIIYQEAIGDYHIHFVDTLYLLSERQYLLEQYEDLSKQATQVIGLLKQQKLSFPIKQWRLMLIQVKTNLQNCKAYKQLLLLIHRYNLDPGYKDLENTEENLFEKTIQKIKLMAIQDKKTNKKTKKIINITRDGLAAIACLIRSEEEEFIYFIENLENQQEEQIVTRLTVEVNFAKQQRAINDLNNLQASSPQLRSSNQQPKTQTPKNQKEEKSFFAQKQRYLDTTKELLPQQQRVLFEGLRGMRQIKRLIRRYLRRKMKAKQKRDQDDKHNIYLEGNDSIIRFEISQLLYEMKQIKIIIITLLGQSYYNQKNLDDD
ncbi:unnamed protein product [Paramecium sonneborni]|uniref:Tetratricopeptide repeat protein n=1 Tax=Paramecium sonneborni TaxID=65129 RepID=A0A8S1NBJ1_9CILI|nr:unnamed protein product [Paramecium sonneborni]